MAAEAPAPTANQLRRELNLPGAVAMGLGSILGTGIFVSIGLAAGIAGPAVVLAITLAAFVATFNALSSAQLAATHSVSGGTYEYGYHFLSPWWGFMAGWFFLLAKSASAATAALGFAGYVLTLLGVDVPARALAFALVVTLTVIVMLGARKTARFNVAIVAVTVAALLLFCAGAAWWLLSGHGGAAPLRPFLKGGLSGHGLYNLAEATALMFVAYTGYGRIATLAEEVENPRQVIPRAIIATLLISAVLYIAVAIAAVGTVGAPFLQQATTGPAAPLSLAARAMGYPWLAGLVALGAATAMLSVLLNLILGLSRVLLAMGRRADAPRALARLDRHQRTPVLAVATIGALVAGLTLIGSVKTTWSFSALTVLVYYAITNAAALAVPAPQRLLPRAISIAGLISCTMLTFFLDRQTWLAALVLLAAGALWFAAARILRRRPGKNPPIGPPL